MLRTQGEVAGSAGVCERGVCGDLAGCLFLTDCSCDTTPSLRPSPATWRSGTLHRASVPARRALSSVCWGWPGPWGGAAGGPGTYTAPTPRKSRSPPRARGKRPEGRDSPSYPATCTRYPDPRLGSVNSQTGYAESLGSSPKPMDPHCPVPPGWGAGGRHVPQGPEHPWGSGIRSRLPLSRPRRAEGAAAADGAGSAPAFPASPARCPESGISAWRSAAGPRTQGLSDSFLGAGRCVPETETEGKAKCTVKGRVCLKEHFSPGQGLIQSGVLVCESPYLVPDYG